MKLLQLTIKTFFVLLILASAHNVFAATFTVVNINDAGAGSLRQAILDANANNADDTINFDPAIFGATAQTITLTSGELLITADNTSGAVNSLTVNGTGANLLTISGNNQSRVFNISGNIRTFINSLKVTGGSSGTGDYGGSGGGIYVRGGGFFSDALTHLTLTNSIVTGNRTLADNGAGGGIFGAGNVTIINSAITNNITPFYGGGIATSYGTFLRITNSTISGNLTGGLGGGIYHRGNTVYITNSTVAFNRAGRNGSDGAGGGVYIEYESNYSRDFYPKNSIFANNFSSPNYGIDVDGRTISQGYNIFGNTGFIITASGDRLNLDPQLDAQLGTNGGVIPTHALRATSPAIDGGDNCVLNATANGGCLDPNITTDARGVARPQDGNSDGAAVVDIGAFEVTAAEVMSAPTLAPDLQAASDTGASDADNVTSNVNPVFNVGGVMSGAFVELLRDGAVVASATAATGNSLVLSDANVAGGVHLYTSRQTVNNQISLQSGGLTVTVDTNAPTVTVNQAGGQADPTSAQTANFTVVFSEAVVGFDASDISLGGSTAGGISSATVTITGGGTTYNVAVGNVAGDGTIVVSIPQNAVQDFAGNASAASTGTDNSVTIDRTAPTVAVNQAASQADPTRFTPVNFTVAFSEPVTGFTAADVSLAGSTADLLYAQITVTGSGATYNVAVNYAYSNGGYIQASVVGAAAADAAGNQSAASTSVDNRITLDNIAPTVIINRAAGQAFQTRMLPINFTVVFSEPVTGFDAADISLGQSAMNTSGAVVTVTGSGATYNVSVGGSLTSNGGYLRATVRSGAALDAVGNSSGASTGSENYVALDNVAPTVTVNQAATQADPTSVLPIVFTVAFNEYVVGFDASDVSFAGSTANVSAASVAVSGGNNGIYTVTVGNITSNGQIRVSVAGGAAQDTTGNSSLASTSADNIVTLSIKASPFDYDGDGKADLSVYRPSNGSWYLYRSKDGYTGYQFGVSTDKIVPADYDGDGRTDVAVYRDGNWFVLQSKGFTFASYNFGLSSDVPAPADFDGDGRSELAVYRPSTGVWFQYNLATNAVTGAQFGVAEDKPVAADYDGDGRADLAVYRPSNGAWYLYRSRDGYTGYQFGVSSDNPVPADYDGDGKTDVAVWRASDSTWYILKSNGLAFYSAQFGVPTDVPAPADFDGDGKTDIAVYRPELGDWYQLRTTTNAFTAFHFGQNGDIPTPNAFVK